MRVVVNGELLVDEGSQRRRATSSGLNPKVFEFILNRRRFQLKT